MLNEVSAACGDVETTNDPDRTGAPDGDLTVVLGLNSPRNVIATADVDSEVARELAPLEGALDGVLDALSELRSRLTRGDYFEYEESVAEARDADRALQDAARGLGVPACAPPEITEQIDGTEALLAEQAAGTAPSGDYRADLEAACDRVTEAANEAIIEGGPGPVGELDDALALAGIYEQLQLDVERLDPGERAAAHEQLLGLIEDAVALARDLNPASDSQEELDAVSAELEEVTDQAERLAAGAGAECDL